MTGSGNVVSERNEESRRREDKFICLFICVRFKGIHSKHHIHLRSTHLNSVI